jgi:outer membrane murein-binding lipoprotein Lpp
MAMTGKLCGAVVFAAALVLGSFTQAQEAANEPTLEERVVALEKEVASLGTRFEVERTLDDDALGDGVLTARVAELERSLERLTTDLDRVSRQVDAAQREATQARREAATASQLARDAGSRLR